MKPIYVAHFVRVFAILSMPVLVISMKLHHFDDCMYAAVLSALLLLVMLIFSTAIIEDYKKVKR